MKIKLYLPFLFFFSYYNCFAQSPYILRNDQAYHTYDRSEILRWSDTTLSNGINNYDRKLTTEYFKTVWTNDALSDKDKFDLLHFFSDNYEFLNTQNQVTSPGNEDDDSIVFKNAQNANVPNKPILRETFEKTPILKYFYKTPANLLQLHTPSFELIVNPIVQFPITIKSIIAI